MSVPIKLIVGLGNPGNEYADTRHNTGIWFVETLANQVNHTLQKEDKFHGAITKVNHCWLLKPSIYMNENGRAVVALARFYKIKSQEILVVHDELDFPVGVIRLKESGGHGGHNGLRNIVEHLKTGNFYRLRIGIGHPEHKDQVIPYVLSTPSENDRVAILSAIDRGLQIINELMRGTFENAMRNLHS
ncbi:aminoacyl-tRNA hydrolase [Coxiella endosymbiont of Amblyomma nuttalli]|uniref:aminoacyl-tRNA hydrolase n=1 Tax=Coxiella endosymbiont of Amblyomma nuttalli TaxID=2749996 RepID=UPI001BA65C9C|nr:aminoacyl-tRNA hydrolase [Coxiella endosymbiont of Amblyomma nuttalli]QTS84240.1 Peptidyl-tRNA hydrolase [Coxiella endosymbiont of Amblyomma nuttalli]